MRSGAWPSTLAGTLAICCWTGMTRSGRGCCLCSRMGECAAPIGPVGYECSGAISVITMDDGKANVMSVQMLRELNAALDRAEADNSVVLLTGRDGVFSAGFDLAVFKQGKAPLFDMLKAGAETAERLLSFPAPVAVACGGHAMPMGP